MTDSEATGSFNERQIHCLVGHQQGSALLYKLSASGAMIELRGLSTKVGDEIQLGLHDLIWASGKVVWRIGPNAGVRFYGILANYIVEHLGYGASGELFDEQTPRDRLGALITTPVEQGVVPLVVPHPLAVLEPTGWLEAAEVQENRRSSDRGDANRRREERLTVGTNAMLCKTIRERVEGRLVDLSESGCSFLDPTCSFQPGEQVWLKLDALELWKGSVRWTHAETVGIEFDRPFYPAVLNHLVERHQAVVVSKAA